MLLNLFDALREEKVPVTLREWLDLLAALEADLAFADIEQFHALARAVLVKDERHFDRFDRAFGRFWDGVSTLPDEDFARIPEDWLRREFERRFSDEDKAKIEQLGGLEELMRRFRERLAEQKERHAGGNRWIGTGGTSPFGSGGFHPGGIRLGPHGGGRMAAKVWEKREYRNLDGDAELSPRNFKTALRRLRRFAREGAQMELDLPRHRARGRPARCETAAGTTQRGEGVAAAGYRRLDGRSRRRLRSAVRRGPIRIQALAALLLP